MMHGQTQIKFICGLDKWWNRVEENGCSVSLTGEYVLIT